MHTSYKSWFAIILTLFLCTCTPLAAFAAGSGTSPADPKVTTVTETTTSQDGATTTTQTTDTSWSTQQPGSHFGTTYQQTEVISTTQNNQGQLVVQSGKTQGSEQTITEQTPPLSIVLQKGDTSATATSDLQNSIVGDLAAADPENYDQTTTTVLQQRSAQVTVGEVVISSGTGSTQTPSQSGLAPIQSVWTGTEQDIHEPRPDRFTADDAQGPAGYPFLYTGWGQDSHYGATYTITDKDGNVIGGDEADIIQFLLTDTQHTEAPDHAVYCVDLGTDVQPGWWYKIDNLEAAGYYTSQAAEDHIYAIATHGYWGTAAGQTGSLRNFQKMLTDAQSNGTTQVQTLLQGQDFHLMTAGEAQAATQIAIWQYGNTVDSNATLSFAASNFDGGSWTWEEADLAAWSRIEAAAAYLIQLTRSADDMTQVITEDKFIQQLQLTVKEKQPDQNSDTTDDKYTADLQFTLSTTPGQKDALEVRILQGGQVIATQPMIAGQQEYTIRDVQLAENADMQLSLQMTGAQYLEQGVYIYTSEARETSSSQTLLGIAEGYRTVDVAMSVTLRMDVTDAIVSTERSWAGKWAETFDISPTPDPTPTPDPAPTPVPEIQPETPSTNTPATGENAAPLYVFTGLFISSFAALAALCIYIHQRKKTVQQSDQISSQ